MTKVRDSIPECPACTEHAVVPARDVVNGGGMWVCLGCGMSLGSCEDVSDEEWETFKKRHTECAVCGTTNPQRFVDDGDWCIQCRMKGRFPGEVR